MATIPEALSHAVQLHQSGRLDEAAGIYRQILQHQPDNAAALHLLGLVERAHGRTQRAIELIARSITLDSSLPEAHYNLGNALRSAGRYEAAVASYRQALALKPADAAIWLNMGNALQALGQLSEADHGYARATLLKPDYADAHLNRGYIAQVKGDLGAAVASYRRAMVLRPDYSEIHNNLAMALQYLGNLEEALPAFGRALALKPGYIDAQRNRIAALLYMPSWNVTDRFAEQRRLEDVLARPCYAAIRPHANVPDPDRPLRIGWLSSDLRRHPVARNVLPLFEAIDRRNFAFFFYAELERPDDVTARFQALAEGWRPIIGLDDAAAAERIRADGIDILVSMAGWLDRNRPFVCAHKPAPIQISLHDVATSGLEVMDYLITDRVMVPRHGPEPFTERPLRLPGFYLAEPITEAPPPAPAPPMLARGAVTFGCFNNPAKVSPAVLALWADLLARRPEARLILKYRNWYQDADTRARIHAVFAGHGVDPARVVIQSSLDALDHHLELYNQIDVALDPFPFCGSTTTFEALWMGVPVVTWPQDAMVSRWSASVLTTLGLTDLIAGSAEDYLAIAGRLADDPARLAALRAALRGRVAASTLCDARLKARHIERLFRAVWRRWCASQAPSA